MTGDARSDEHRAVNGRDHVKSADALRIFGQLIAASRAMAGIHERMPGQFLQNLGHSSGGDAVLFGDFAGAASVRFAAMQSQMFYGDQAVVCFF